MWRHKAKASSQSREIHEVFRCSGIWRVQLRETHLGGGGGRPSCLVCRFVSIVCWQKEICFPRRWNLVFMSLQWKIHKWIWSDCQSGEESPGAGFSKVIWSDYGYRIGLNLENGFFKRKKGFRNWIGSRNPILFLIRSKPWVWVFQNFLVGLGSFWSQKSGLNWSQQEGGFMVDIINKAR